MLRVGVIGTDGHGRSFTTALNGAVDGKPHIEGVEVTAAWAPDKSEATKFAAELDIANVPDRPEDMIGEIDLALVLFDGDAGASHAQLARPFLTAGIPTFVDRPLTPNLRDSVDLIRYAQEHGAPLMTGSALRYATEVDDLRAHMGKRADLSAVMVTAPGHWWYYALHSVELVRAVVGGKVSQVRRHALGDRDVAILSTEAGPTILVTLLRDVRDRFHLALHSFEGVEVVEIQDHWLPDRDAGAHTFRTRMMAAAVDMARSGQPPVPYEESIEDLAVLAAGQRSAVLGEPVSLAQAYREADAVPL